MNNIIQDNRVATMREYLRKGLLERYEERETANIISALFDAFKGWTRSEQILHQHEHISESEMLKFHFALKELKKGIPLQYVLGKTWFRNKEFIVTPAVLIPRPETEELVEIIVGDYQNQAISVLDIGTGSGCIAIALALELPGADISAIDVSPEALEVAQRNATIHQVNIRFNQCDILNALPDQKFDVVVSNPPYIPLSEHTKMPEVVTAHEPHVALFTTDNDPLVFYKRLTQQYRQLLKPGGKFFFEIHEDSKADLEKMLASYNNIQYTFHQDMQEKWRILSVMFFDDDK